MKRTALEDKALLKWWCVIRSEFIRSWKSPEAIVHQEMQT